MTKTEKLLRELIAIPSINPAFLPVGDRHAGEHAVAEFLGSTASRAGLDVRMKPVTKGRSNVMAVLSPKGRVKQRVLLAPHMDTVGGENLAELLTPRLHRGRLYGRGACDTKGSIAAMLLALMELTGSSRRPQGTEIVFAALVDEECSQTGSRNLGERGFKADLAIVGEPTMSRVVTAHKGVLWFTLTTQGKEAHGARPELGKNAIVEMARVVEAIESDYAATLRRGRAHALLGRATVNVGSIRGGRQPNIVPADCRISVDRRTLPGERIATVFGEIRTLLREKGLKVELRDSQTWPCLPMETDFRRPLVSKLLGITKQKQPLGVHYFSDAGVLAGFGIPSVLFGPGDIAQAHTPDEWIAVKQLEMAKQILFRFLSSLP